MKAIIIDDIPEAIQALKLDLTDYCPEIQIVGTAESVVEAAKLINRVHPELIFLDIMLPDGSGFDLLDIIQERKAQVIFTTASNEHALRAFQYAAVDYLLKPIEADKLVNAVTRAELLWPGTADSLKALKQNILTKEKPDQIVLSTADKYLIVPVREIIRCESDDNCTRIYTQNHGQPFITRPLKYFDQLLGDRGFIRTHQSHLINANFIKEFIKIDGGYIKLADGTNIPVSVRRKAQVIQWIDKLMER